MNDYYRIEDDAPARRVLYSSALLLIAIPFIQAISQIWPLQLSNIQWRFGAANALSSILLLPFLGLALLLVMARVMASRILSLTVGTIAAVFSIGLAASALLFILDGLQLKAIVNSAQMSAFKTAFARVGVVTVLFVIVFALLALAALKAPKNGLAPAKKGVKQAEEGLGLIVGRA